MPTYAVVGGSRGIGLELVRQLSADPDNVVRNKAKATHLAPVAAAANVHVLQADVVDHRALQVYGEIAQVMGGPLDVLVHNAARMENATLYHGLTDLYAAHRSFRIRRTLMFASLAHIASENLVQLDTDFIDAFKVNVLEIVHSITAFMPLLRQGTVRKICVVSTLGAERKWTWDMRNAGMAVYGTTRAGSNVVVAKYAALLEGEGFTVFAVSPGLVDTSETAVDKLVSDGREAIERVLRNIPSFNGVMDTPAQVVGQLLQVVASATQEDSGAFIAHTGEKI